MSLSPPAKTAAAALYLGGLAACRYGFAALPQLNGLNGRDVEAEFAGHYQFLTIVSLWATQATMVLSLAALVVPALALPKTFLSVSVLPVEVLVSLLYWSLHFINPDLLVPPKMVPDPNSPGQMIAQRVHLPLDIDMSMHLAPAVILLADFLVFSPPFPKRLRPALICGAATLGYCLWAEYCNSINGRFAYPLLDILPPPARGALYLGCAATMMGVLAVARAAHASVDKQLGRVWTEQPADETAKRLKQKAKKKL